MPSGRTILWFLFWAFLIWWVISNPAGAAHAVHAIGHLFTRVAAGLSSFFSSLGG
jgi:hypothetical protein